MVEFIIATHSYLAEGYKKSLIFFGSKLENIHFINAYSDKNNNFVDEIKKILNKFSKHQVIILTDLPGGSVNKESLSFIKDNNCKVISGINLSLVLELVMSGKSILTENDIISAVNQARQQIIYMNDFLKEDD